MEGTPERAAFVFRFQATSYESLRALRLTRGPVLLLGNVLFSVILLAGGVVLVSRWDMLGLILGAGLVTAGGGSLVAIASTTAYGSGPWLRAAARETTATFDQTGVTIAETDQTRWIGWPAVTGVKVDRRVVVLVRGQTRMCFLPTRIFSSRQEQADFVSFVRSQLTGPNRAAQAG